MIIQLLNLKNILRTIGRGVIMLTGTQAAPAKWDGVTDMSLFHLGDSEGDIQVAFNESFVHLTTPELTGAGKHKSYVEGEDPTLQIPTYLADPALRAIVSPTGNASGGYSRRRPVKEHTLVIFPEELFYNEATGLYDLQLAVTTAANGDGTWTLGGQALTPDQEALLGQSVWFWRGYFPKAPMTFKHGDAGKAVDTISFQAMLDLDKPEGHMLYTIGDPTAAGIDLEPVTTP